MWTESGVRSTPFKAFDALNVEKDNRLTVEELCLVPQDLESAMPLLKALGVPMDMKITRPEFGDLVKDKRTFSDSAVAWLTELCKRRDSFLLDPTGGETKEDPELVRQDMHQAAILTTIALHRATQIRWRNECVARMARARAHDDPSFGGGGAGLLPMSLDVDAVPHDLVIELISTQFTLVDSAFYDALNIAGPASASIFVVVYDAETHVELGRTDIVTAKTAADFPPVKIDADDANSIFFSLFAVGSHVNIFIGKTDPIPVPIEFTPSDSGDPNGPVVALGPLDLVAAEGTLAGRVFGTLKWARDTDIGDSVKCKSSTTTKGSGGWCLANTCLGWY